MESSIEALVNKPYKHGFKSDIESDIVAKGLNEAVIKLISEKKANQNGCLSLD